MGEQCSDLVPLQGTVTTIQCSRDGTVESDGRWYCWQHDPKAVKARRKTSIDRSNAFWDAKCAARQAAKDAIWNEAIEAAAVELDSIPKWEAQLAADKVRKLKRVTGK
ncbi:hypothetical protein LCGC14_1447580 [marine sediment metagenome]|uniref:Uncharacterized protein n=1 Tax=marine sediment metagenome TaxID=412755 RepID=A0A0F9MKQ3_9ZZZZ